MAKKQPTQFCSLPNEIVVHILSYIHPIYSNILSLRCVCVKWKDLIEKTVSLWKHIHLDDDRDCRSNQHEIYQRTLRYCFDRFGEFIQCLRAEDQSYCFDYKLRQHILKLRNLQKLDVPILYWTRSYAEKLRHTCGPNIKYVTIDDCKILKKDAKRVLCRGLNCCDFKFIHSWFPNLEILCLHTAVHKLGRDKIVSILNTLNLKELHLELAPYGMKEKGKKRREAYPVLEIMNSKFASILTSLELRYLTLTSQDLMMITKGFTGLKHLVVGSVSTRRHNRAAADLHLQSTSLRMLLLSSLPSYWTTSIKVAMSMLEVLVVSECLDLDTLTIEADCLMSLVLRDNYTLSCIKANCESLTDLQIEDCNCFALNNFKSLIKDCPMLERVELCSEWNEIDLTSDDCPELRKVILREVDLDLYRVNIDCPKLEIFKCIGNFVPNKRLRKVRLKGLEISLTSRRLRKVNFTDVYHADKVTINSQSIDQLQISGRALLPKPLHMILNASQRIGEVIFVDQCLQSISVHSPCLGELVLDNCSLSGENKCRFKLQCERIKAMRIMNCSTIRRFSLKVPYIESLTLDSCANMCSTDIISDYGHVRNMRVINCPLLLKSARNLTL